MSLLLQTKWLYSVKAADAKTALEDSLLARSKGPLIRTVLYEINTIQLYVLNTIVNS